MTQDSGVFSFPHTFSPHDPLRKPSPIRDARDRASYAELVGVGTEPEMADRAVLLEINGDNCSVDICSTGWQSEQYVTFFDGKCHGSGRIEMRIVSSQVSGGSLYRIYREDAHFVTELQQLIPFLNGCAGSVLIGGTDGDPDVVLTVG